MAPILRFIGLLNAAVWLGALIFFTGIVGPGIFSAEVKQAVRADWIPGVIAQVLIGRYMLLQEWCAGIALIHLILDWLYTGRLVSKAPLFIMIICLGLSIAGTELLVPQMRQLHVMKYSPQSTQAQKDYAAKNFGILHGASQMMNLLIIAGVLFHYWKLAAPAAGGRSGGGARYRA